MVSRKVTPVQEARSAKDPEVFARLARSKNDEVLLALAENEDAPQEILEAIVGKTKNALVRSAVARHPATSLDTLNFLFQIEFYRSIASNPMIPLLKDLGSDSAHFIWECIAITTKDPEEMLGIALSGDSNLQEKLVMRIDELTEETVDALLQSIILLIPIAAHAGTPPRVIDKIVELAFAYNDKNLFYALGRSALSDENILNIMSFAMEQETEEKRNAILFNIAMSTDLREGRRLPDEFINFVVNYDVYDTWSYIAEDPGLTGGDVIYMIKKLLNRSMHHVSQFPNYNLRVSTDYPVGRLCSNKFLSPETLAEIFNILFKSKMDTSKNSVSNIYTLAANKNTPVEFLMKILAIKWGRSWHGVLYNPSIPTDVLEKYSKSSRKSIRSSVAANVSAPVDMLMRLSSDPEIQVLQAVCRNPNSTPDVLRNVFKTRPREAKFVAMNESCPEDLLDLFSKGNVDARLGVALNDSAPVRLLRGLSKDRQKGVRSFVAKNKNCPPDVLLALSKDEEASIRREAMANPNCPPEAVWL